MCEGFVALRNEAWLKSGERMELKRVLDEYAE
jgi:hypothetical protein